MVKYVHATSTYSVQSSSLFVQCILPILKNRLVVTSSTTSMNLHCHQLTSVPPSVHDIDSVCMDRE